MSGQGAWLADSLSDSSTFSGLDLFIEKLKSDYLKFMEAIVNDKRNYMATVIGDNKEYLVTSKLVGIVELTDPADFANGTSFKMLGNSVSIAASYAISSSTDASVWTLDKVLAQMANDFVSIRSEVAAPIQEGYAGTTNLISSDNIDILNSHNVVKKTEPIIEASSMNIDAQNTSEKGMTTANHFIDNFVTKDGIGEVDQIITTFDPLYNHISFRTSELEEVILDVTDGDLTGAGSKLSDYAVVDVASAASDAEMNIDIPLDHESASEGEYFVTIGGTDYSYIAMEGDTADIIASELETALGDEAGLTVTNVVGKYGKVYENMNEVKSLAVWNNDVSEDMKYEIALEENSSDEGPVGYTIEDTNGDGSTLTVYFPLDAGGDTDIDNSTLQSLVNAINEASFWNGGAMIMPGEDPSEPYDSDTGVLIELVQTTSRVHIISDSDVTITTNTTVDSVDYTELCTKTVTSVFSQAQDQSGTVVIEAINPNVSMTISIDETDVVLDLSLEGNAGVLSPQLAAEAFVVLINEETSNATATSSANTITLDSASSGAVFTVVTSGESADYAVALQRDVMLKHDIENNLSVNDKSISPLKIEQSNPTTDRSVLSRTTLKNMADNGYLYSKHAMMWPNIEYRTTEGSITTQRNMMSIVTGLINKYSGSFSARDTAYVSKSFPIISKSMFAPARSKSDRWFFLEAKPTILASKRSIDIVMNTLPPEEFEKIVLGDSEANFSAILNNSTPSGFFEAESISRLWNEPAIGKAKCDFNIESIDPFPVYNIDSFNVEQDMFYISTGESDSIEIIDGYMLRALLPEDLRGNLTIDGFNYLFRIALSAADELQEERFIELAGMLVLSADDLGTNLVSPQAASYVFGTDSAPVNPVISNGIDGIPVNGTLTMERLYFRNFRNIVLNRTDKHVSSATIGRDTELVQIALRMFNIIPAINNGQSFSSNMESLYSIFYGEVFTENISNMFNDSLYEELIRTGYFPGDISGLIKAIGHGMSHEFKDSTINTLMEAIQIKDDGNIISVGSAKTILHEIYIESKTEIPMSEIDMMMLCMPYSVMNGVVDETPKNIVSAGFNICAKVFLYLIRNSIAFTSWEKSFRDIQISIFDETDDTVKVLPFIVFEIFLANTGFLAENAGDTTIDGWISNVEEEIISAINPISKIGIYNNDDGVSGIKTNPILSTSGLSVMIDSVPPMAWSHSLNQVIQEDIDVTITRDDLVASVEASEISDRSAVLRSGVVFKNSHGTTVDNGDDTYTLSVQSWEYAYASVSIFYDDKYGSITEIIARVDKENN